MEKLWEKTSIKSIDLPNRSVRSATWSGVGDQDGYVTDLALQFYRELAEGGIGLIVTGYQFVLPNGKQLQYMIGNCDESMLEGLTRLAAAIHEGGGRAVTQLVHCGVRANTEFIPDGWEHWGPSAIPDPISGKTPKEMTTGDIHQLVEAFAAAADRSRRAGFDGIQLHAAHGYGINQFLSAFFNRRSDAYGGDLNRRYRFLGEVMEAVRGQVGDDFPVLIKLNGHDYVEGGLTPEETVKIARRLEEDGIDAIEVSGGSPASPANMGPARTGIVKEEKEAYFVDLAAAIKESVKVPVITVGGIRSLSTIGTILSESKADYVAMCRPFIREPHLMKRWESGDTAKAACISCNKCFQTGLQGKGISCGAEREQAEKE